ncbi:hypothetical protein BUALT_Bualt01G0146900 [Buddleja alternifolia]|uniref:GTD-binding domain-containing protein n=1 Tax=Buddleja alternifolia TaxID=168488 RepID=A0AAV6YHM2_9LAMI|nr:hypothetical protein BUALT_Bualt01G0146900 [Buddleja alternifolia]
MDLKRIRFNESKEKVSLSITSVLVSAVLEWMLMFMLFVDASFSFLVTRFARYCQLQIPCLLCSRLDHVLGNERAGFYWDLICHKHKLNISSLILCQLHNNLVDVHGTCESCFFSFATVNKSNAETYRLLVGKLGDEPYNGLTQGASGTTKCSCCNEQRISKSIDSDDLKSKLKHMWDKDADPLPHVKYREIKVTSDTESEGPFSDNEICSALIREMETVVQDSVTKHVFKEPQIITLADCSIPPIKLSHLESDDTNVESGAPLGHGLEELNWQQAEHNKDVNAPSVLISFPEAIPSPNIDETHNDEPKEIHDSFSNELAKEVHIEIIEASNMGSDSTGATALCEEVTVECAETSVVASDSTAANEIQIDSKPNENDTSLQMAEFLDLGDAYKLALGTRGRQLSGRLLEQKRSMTDSTRVSADLKLLLSQISAARGIEISLNDMSPRVSANIEDSKVMDAIGMQIFQRRISLERNESNLSLDGSTVSEIEGESVVDRLKRQVEHDKKIMGTLYKELEEERNASAVAANQAMAMITRLQEEKASLHMEALQYLRMMEEQSEYDGEALQKANDLLAEREKQIQDFEFELELYRNQLGDISLSDNFVKSQKLERNCEEGNTTAFHNSDNDDTHGTINKTDEAPPQDVNSRKSSLPHFEEEKQYILLCLEKLEKKLFNEVHRDRDVANGDFSVEEVLDTSASDKLDSMEVSHEIDGKEKNHLPGDTLVCKEALPSNLSGHENSQNENEAIPKLRCTQSSGADLYALRDELYDMNNRLEALEAEQNFIECLINSLEKGSAGFEFIQEIALRLRELHSAQTRTRNEDLT